MEGCFMFQWERASFLSGEGGVPHGGASTLVGGGGGFKKNFKMGGGGCPTMGNPDPHIKICVRPPNTCIALRQFNLLLPNTLF